MASRTRVVATAAAVVLAYAAGTATGVLTGSPSDARGHSVLDQAERTIESRAAKPVPRSDLEHAAVQGMLKALGDQWSAYYAPTDFAQFQQVLSGAYTGVGVWVRRTSGGALKVTTVQPNSPAAKAGLRAGDLLTQVDGAPVAGRTVADVVSGLRGKPGTDVTVAVQRGTQRFTTTLRRTTITNDDVSASVIGPGVEMLRISAFTRGVGRWVRTQITRAQREGLRGMVLDLRDDPGGLLDE